MKELMKTIKIYFFLFILVGLLYPFTITFLSQVLFKDKANGSIIYKDGVPVGSTLVGQPFESPYLFWSRPSATGYNTIPSGGFNLGPTSPELYKLVNERVEKLVKEGIGDQIPSYLVFASASGIDPHLPPWAVYPQVKRVSKNTGLPEQKLYELIQKHTEKRTFGFLGEERVNILKLNLEVLDLIKGNGFGK